MSASAHLLLEIEKQECRRLLGTAGLGRLGFTERALPMILPVHYALRGDDVVLSSMAGSKLAAARNGSVLAFEVDDYDPVNREGWTVSVIGPSRLITDPDEIALLDALDFAPWTGSPGQAYFAVQMALLQGRRVVRAAAVNDGLAATTLAPEA